MGGYQLTPYQIILEKESYLLVIINMSVLLIDLHKPITYASVHQTESEQIPVLCQ